MIPTATGFTWLTFGDTLDAPPEIGGPVTEYESGTANLLIGDIVFASAVRRAGKSTTPANYAGFLGVVVGGIALDWLPGQEQRSFLGRNVAPVVGNRVYVAGIGSIVWAVADGAITAGTNFSVIPSSTTAGRVIAGTTAGQIVGIPLTSTTAAGQPVLLRIEHR